MTVIILTARVATSIPVALQSVVRESKRNQIVKVDNRSLSFRDNAGSLEARSIVSLDFCDTFR